MKRLLANNKKSRKTEGKVMFKKTRLLLAISLTFIMSFASVQSVLAAGEPVTGSEAKPAEAAITKILKLPIGTDIPAATFKFVAAPVKVDGVDYNSSNMPQIGTGGIITIQYTGNELNDVNGTTVQGITAVPKESGNIFGNVPWPHAGEYVYVITEVENTNTVIDADQSQDLKYNKTTKYTVTVFVRESKATPGTYYVFAYGAEITVKDNDDQEEGSKVDATPKDPVVTGGYSNMIFTNTYVKTNGGTDPKTNDKLFISKKVDGEFASTTVYFDYELTVTAPSLVSGAPVYKAYVVADIDNVATVVTSAANGDIGGSDDYGSYINFVSGTAKSFRLKDGQKLVFVSTPVGANYKVSESAANAYKPSVTAVYNGKELFTEVGKLNFGLAIPSEANPDPLYVGETNTGAKFVNTRDEVLPTGLNVNDLPFIGIILLAMGALIAFVVVKSRKKKECAQ